MKIDSATSHASPQTKKAPDQMNQQEFLMLLTTQLSQQDPLNPMDNQQFVAQLSQMASVERLENISQSIYQLAMAQAANTSAQMVSFIGHDVRISENEITVEDGATTYPFGFDLAEDAESVEVVIRDENGRVIETLELGPTSAGPHDVDWDGTDQDGSPVPDGEYTFEITARDADDQTLPALSFTRRRVDGVTFESGMPRLLLEGGGDAGMGQIQEVARS